jgi:hypothetical protein
VEVFAPGSEPVSCAADRRAVDGPVERLELVRLLSDAVVVLPGGVDVLADLLTLLTEQALGLGDKPCGVLDIAGLLNPLAEQLDALDRADLLSAPLLRADDPPSCWTNSLLGGPTEAVTSARRSPGCGRAIPASRWFRPRRDWVFPGVCADRRSVAPVRCAG